MKNLRPYQLELVRTILSLRYGDRLLLNSPPGFGKTAAIVVAMAEFFRERNTEAHALVIAPRPLGQYLTEQLRIELEKEVTLIDAPEYRRLQAMTPAGENLWASVPVVVVSADFIKEEGRLEEVLEIPWDIVFMDEAHREASQSFRARMMRALWESPMVAIAIASAGDAAPPWVENTLSLKTIRWTYQSAGIPHWSNRNIQHVEYRMSEAEREFALEFLETLNGFEGLNPRSMGVATLLRSRLASSLLSAEQSLRSYESTLDGQSFDADDGTVVLENKGARGGLSGLLAAEGCRRLLELFERIEVDSKWEACANLMRAISNESRKHSIVIFTSLASTSYYVGSMAEDLGSPIYSIRGNQKADTITKTLKLAEEHPGVLISTELPLQGFELDFTDQVIHYDVPQNLNVLALRFSRFLPRQAGEPINHYFLLDNLTLTKEELNRAIEGVLNVEKGWE